MLYHKEYKEHARITDDSSCDEIMNDRQYGLNWLKKQRPEGGKTTSVPTSNQYPTVREEDVDQRVASVVVKVLDK